MSRGSLPSTAEREGRVIAMVGAAHYASHVMQLAVPMLFPILEPPVCIKELEALGQKQLTILEDAISLEVLTSREIGKILQKKPGLPHQDLRAA